MTAPLSDDLRVRLVAAVEAGETRRSAAKRFGVAPSTAIKWMALWRQEGHVKPRPMGGDRRSHQTEVHAPAILKLVEEKPDITVAEIVAHLRDEHGVGISDSAVWRLLDRHDLTFKKNRACRRAAAS